MEGWPVGILHGSGVGPSIPALVRRAAHEHPSLFRPALAKLEKLEGYSMGELVERVPTEWMSLSARRFAAVLMGSNLERLQELFR